MPRSSASVSGRPTAIDPQHRLLLETAWEAVEHAGLAPHSLAGSVDRRLRGPVARRLHACSTRDAGALDQAYGFTGTPFSMASGRISYALGLRGPAMTVDTACSSGLLTVHLACRSLARRRERPGAGRRLPW